MILSVQLRFFESDLDARKVFNFLLLFYGSDLEGT